MSHFDQFANETIYHRLNQLIDLLDSRPFARLNTRDAATLNHVRKELQQISNLLYLAWNEYRQAPDVAQVVNDLLEQSHNDMQQAAAVAPEMEAYHKGWQDGLMRLFELLTIPIEESEAK